MGSVAHVEEERKELAKDVHWLAHLGIRLMSISDNDVTVQNGSESSLVVEVKGSKTVIQSCLSLRVQSTIREWRFSPKGKMVYFAIKHGTSFNPRSVVLIVGEGWRGVLVVRSGDSFVCTGVVKRMGWHFGGQIWWFICRSLEWQRGWSGVFVPGGVVVGGATVGCCLLLQFIGGWISSWIAV
ncbi:hypothetical protein MTR67_022605 [Solanum verrucosum]|uniref:Uncharacterized protein n=1 Tax=Solanum verrucosum TaxID=315347 RepID=A0AAF0QY66_SOLVR|nr:hypothetical protein MTR67_022605 [Solanum verrucosum]